MRTALLPTILAPALLVALAPGAAAGPLPSPTCAPQVGAKASSSGTARPGGANARPRAGAPKSSGARSGSPANALRTPARPLGAATAQPALALPGGLPVLGGSEPAGHGEPVSVHTSDELELAGAFFAPRDQSGRAPAVILVHDAGADRHQLDRLAETLRKRDFAVLAIDLRGHGESASEEIAWKAGDDEANRALWAFALRDVDAAARWLRTRPDVHASNLSLVGIGAGAALAVRHAVRDENVRAVVIAAPEENELGFNLLHDLRELGGLPTLVLAEKGRGPDAERLESAAEEAEGIDFVEVVRLKSERNRVGQDKRFFGETLKFLREHAMPKRGDR